VTLFSNSTLQLYPQVNALHVKKEKKEKKEKKDVDVVHIEGIWGSE